MTTVITDNIELRSIPRDAGWVANSANPVVLPKNPVKSDTLTVTALASIVAVGETIYHIAKEDFSKDRVKKIWKPVAQNAGAVPVWDLAQKLGYSLTTGVAKGLAASTLLVGICAGPAAFLAGYLYELATDEITREMWLQNSSLMAKKFVKDLALSATIGAIPNAIWNLVFVLSFFILLSVGCPPIAAVLLTAFLVSGIVAYSNVQFGEKAMEAADKKIQKILDQNLNEEYEKLREQISPETSRVRSHLSTAESLSVNKLSLPVGMGEV